MTTYKARAQAFDTWKETAKLFEDEREAYNAVLRARKDSKERSRYDTLTRALILLGDLVGDRRKTRDQARSTYFNSP